MNAPANLPAPMAAGGNVAALIPQSLEEAFRVAQAISRSGLAPASLKEPEKVWMWVPSPSVISEGVLPSNSHCQSRSDAKLKLLARLTVDIQSPKKGGAQGCRPPAGAGG